MASFDKGTRCSFSAFIRSLGIIQTLFLKSISCHLAPKISPERQAVKIANSRALGEIPFSVLSAG
jgi:hypothetical protein